MYTEKAIYCRASVGCQNQVRQHGDMCPACKAHWERDRAMDKQTHSISTLEKFPREAHYAVITTKTESHIDPYEDTNPSGRGTYSSNYIEYTWFETEEALNHWILKQAEDKSYYKKPYKVIYIRPVEVKLKTEISIAKE